MHNESRFGGSRRFGRPRLWVIVVLVQLALLASSCGSSNNPTSWADAMEQRTLEENFMRSCQEANVGGDLDLEQAAQYCTCAFQHLVDRYENDFDGFKEAESRLRSDPNDIDASLSGAFLSCATQ